MNKFKLTEAEFDEAYGLDGSFGNQIKIALQIINLTKMFPDCIRFSGDGLVIIWSLCDTVTLPDDVIKYELELYIDSDETFLLTADNKHYSYGHPVQDIEEAVRCVDEWYEEMMEVLY